MIGKTASLKVFHGPAPSLIGVACWNATMDENRYMVRKWNEFVAA
jgi:hypothetical protein